MSARKIAAVVFGLLLLTTSQSGAQQQDASDECRKIEPDWTSTESWTWKTLCESDNNSVDLKRTDGDSVLRASFITKIFTSSPYSDRTRGRQIAIINAQIKQSLEIRGPINAGLAFINCEFENIVDFSYSVVSGQLSFVGTNLLGGIRASNTQVHGSFQIQQSHSRNPIIVNSIVAPRAKVTGDFIVSGAKIAGVVHLPALEAKYVTIANSEVHDTNFANSIVEGQLVLRDTTFSPSAQTINSDGGEVLNLFSVRVAKDLFLNRSVVLGPINLEGAEINGWLRLLGAQLHTVIAKGIIIKGAFVVGDVVRRPNTPLLKTKWEPNSQLDLSYANIGIIETPYNQDYWPQKLILKNFNTKGFEFGWNIRQNDRQTISDWAVSWLAKQEDFSPQPYYRTQHILLESGDSRAAAAVGYAGRDRELTQAWRDRQIGMAIYLTFSKFVIGYGYRIWLSVLWAIGFVLLGAIIFRRTNEARAEHMPYGLAYSFDTLLPLIKLRDRHYHIDIAGPARYYFYLHKLAGWILGIFIIGGLSGLTK
jgi:hypothetical protein